MSSKIRVLNAPQTQLNITNGITKIVRVVARGPQGIRGPSGGNVIMSNDEPITDLTPGSLWFCPPNQLLSVFDGTDWIPQRVDMTETFTQGVPSATWDVHHGMGKFPSVTVIDSEGEENWGTVKYISNEELTITFSAAFSGHAILN